MYSPFYYKKGNPMDISKIKYCHLEQLADCEEGHHLEFKEKLEDGGNRECGLPYASKEINRSRIYYLKEHKKVRFSTLVGSRVNDFIGPAYVFESDVI